MLTDIKKREIKAEIEENHDRRSACVNILKMMQQHHRYVSDQMLHELALLLEMTADELEGVATFYNLIFRHPVGEYVLKVCDSVVCWSLDGQSLMEYVEQRLGIKAGETTQDGRFTLLPCCCLGDCDHAPVMMVNDELIRHVTPQLINEIINCQKGVQE